jgi:3-isopropylmalate dehydrogenase
MFGDIISDLAVELSGSLGLGASLNSGRDHAMAQAQHGSAPDIAGQGIANPSALIGSTAMLFQWLGQKHNCLEFQTAAAQIDAALESVLSDPTKRTRDLGGPLGTEAFTDALITALGHF